MFKKLKEDVKKFYEKRIEPILDAASAFHDKHCMKVWNIVLFVGTALVVGWVYLRR